MRKLKYFKLNASLEDLKTERNKYAKKFHPDKQTSEALAKKASNMMALINDEYDYVTKPENRIPVQPSAFEEAINDQWKRDQVFYAEKDLYQAQNLFHALSNGKAFDYELFVNTANAVTNWRLILEIYSAKYGDFVQHIKKYIKDKKDQKYIIDTINLMFKQQTEANFKNNINSLFSFLSKILKP